MDVKLENLIEKIKKEGVEEARETSEKMVQDSRTEAKAIVEKAEKDASQRMKEAEAHAERFQKQAELAIRQSMRDAVLALKEQLTALFDRVFRQEVADTLKPDVLEAMILKVVGAWAEKPEMEITVSDADRKALEALLAKALNKALKDAVTLRASGDIGGGFRIGLKKGDVYYDFSDESIAGMLRHYLNPKINEILDRQDG